MTETTAPPAEAAGFSELEAHRRELTAYCYRMLGGASEAEDAVQDTLLKAWRNLDRFEGRSSMRTWLYRIATNVCLDMLGSRQRRARPMDFGPASTADSALPQPRPEETWLEPMPDGAMLDAGDPAELAIARETVRLAFVAALQHLPAKQRAVLVLREVLRFSAAEVAQQLETSVASVNSALQRARATLDAKAVTASDVLDATDEDQADLLARYVDAFERYDLDDLTALLHADAIQSMPPFDLWLQGHDEIRAWYLGTGIGCAGSRLVPTVANGMPAYGQYRPASDGGHEPWALQVIEIRDGKIAAMNAFLDTARWFPLFGLPARLDPPT